MNWAILVDAITYSCLISLMSFGLAFVRITTGVWNVAHAGLVTIGAYVVFISVALVGGSPYIYLPLAFIACSLVAILEYITIIEPLRRRKASTIMMLVATLSLDLFLFSLLNILADYLQFGLGLPSKNFLLRSFDFNFLGLPGIFWSSLLLLIFSLGFLQYLLKHTTVGISLRASINNPLLAPLIGVSITRVNMLSWLISGGFAGLSGGLLPLWTQGKPVLGDSLLPVMFCVAIVGGVEEVFGTFIGGILVGFTQTLLTFALSLVFGPGVIPYKTLIPMVILAITLLFAPRGITGIEWRRFLSLLRARVIAWRS
ncbi:MAG: branched-chain amino acid ABC transporter permease [Candidatus Methanodesulfokora sp.]